jgi:hypothetical protein
MRNVKELRNLLETIKSQGFEAWLDELTFLRIFLIWITIIVSLGVLYFLLANGHGYLTNTATEEKIGTLTDAVYFSFITATTTGFGDIIPHGFFKVMAILEAIFGFILLALVTSKIIAVKQNTILGEIYEISFNERVNRLRASFLLFRQDLTRITNKIEENTLHRRELKDLHIYIAPLEDALSETFFLFQRATKSSFVKSIDPLNTELILHSILNSYEKINELVETMQQKKVEEHLKAVKETLERCISITEKIFEDARITKEVEVEKVQGLETQKREVLEILKKYIHKK